MAERKLTEFEMAKSMSMGYWPDSGLGVFSNRQLFIGQERARGELVDIISQSPPGTAVIISEMLGAGKSAFISMVRQDLIDAGIATYEETPRIGSLGLRRHTTLQEIVRDYGYDTTDVASDLKVLFIEEFDRKAPLHILQDEMRIASALLGREASIVVLSGDYCLRNPKLPTGWIHCRWW